MKNCSIEFLAENSYTLSLIYNLKGNAYFESCSFPSTHFRVFGTLAGDQNIYEWGYLDLVNCGVYSGFYHRYGDKTFMLDTTDKPHPNVQQVFSAYRRSSETTGYTSYTRVAQTMYKKIEVSPNERIFIRLWGKCSSDFPLYGIIIKDRGASALEIIGTDNMFLTKHKFDTDNQWHSISYTYKNTTAYTETLYMQFGVVMYDAGSTYVGARVAFEYGKTLSAIGGHISIV